MSLINVSDLTFCYEGSFDNIFEHVSFSIDTDWRLGFIGRNGKGKTTFLNLLLGKYEYEGSIANSVIFDYFPYEVSKEDLEKTYQIKCLAIQADVSKEDEVKATCSLILKKYGRVDILVNNAGIWRNGNSLFADSRSEDWKRKIDVNILGTMYFCRAVLNNMIEKRYGRIINIASVAGVYGIRTMTDYSMTKGAIISFTRALAKEVTEYGVTVNSVSPGNILSDPQKETDNPQLSFAGRSGTNAECANLVRFLASDDASYISGQNYLVDGCRKKM